MSAANGRIGAAKERPNYANGKGGPKHERHVPHMMQRATHCNERPCQARVVCAGACVLAWPRLGLGLPPAAGTRTSVRM